MKIKQTILILTLLIGFGGVAVSPIVSAAIGDQCGDKILTAGQVCCGTDILESGQSCCGGVVTTLIDCSEQTGTGDITNSGLWGILLTAINILTAGIGIAAVGGVVYGSILYGTAGGEAANVKKAKEMIVNVVIGLVAYAFMYALLNYLIPGGIL